MSFPHVHPHLFPVGLDHFLGLELLRRGKQSRCVRQSDYQSAARYRAIHGHEEYRQASNAMGEVKDEPQHPFGSSVGVS